MLIRRLVNYTKRLVAGAGVVTALSIGAMGWFTMKAGDHFPASRAFQLAGIDVPRRYVLASERRGLGLQDFVEQLLDLPAIAVLFVALALFLLFYAWLLSVEETLFDASHERHTVRRQF
jgi:hypothetical protein